MPSTVNGIGTRYVGKKNAEKFAGVCQGCGRQGQLENYETGLWFSFLYVPLIPLGRKQLLNYCSSCSRHNALDLSEWEKIKDQAVRRDMEAMSQNPDDAAAALKFFSTLQAFRKQAEAADLASILQNRFGNNPEVQIELGSWHESLNRAEQALGCFQKALELAPDNLTAKRAVAFCLIRQGRLADAIRVLETPPQLMPLHDPSLFVMLARGFQNQQQHEEALHWLEQVLQVAPQAGRESDFRKLVRTSEKQTSRTTSMLPHIAFYRTPAFAYSAIALLVVGLIGFSNYYIAHHRTLQIVNGLAVPVQVQVDGAAPLVVGPSGRNFMQLAEGSHTATVTANGKELQKADFAVEAGFFGRFFKKPAYVLNAAGAGVVTWEKTTYSKAPHAGQNEVQFHYGEPFVTYEDVDYVFEDFPQTLKVKGSKTVTKTRVSVFVMQPEDILRLDDGKSDPKKQLSFLESHLGVSPKDKTLLQMYTIVGMLNNESQHCLDFLATRLTERPVLIEWHRMYQSTCENTGHDEGLAEQYRKWLAQDPKNSALLYLMGRVESNSHEAMKRFDEAIAADRENPYAWFAKGYQLDLQGDPVGARDCAQEACKRLPKDEQMQSALRGYQIGAKDYADVETKLRAASVSDPLDLENYQMLQEALIAQGKVAETTQVKATFENAIANVPPGEISPQSAQRMRTRAQTDLLYLQGNHQRMLEVARADPYPEQVEPILFAALLEFGELDEAAKAGADSLPGDQANLLLSIGWRQKGDAAKADQWWNEAVENMASGSADDRKVAEIMKNAAECRLEDVVELTVPRETKAIVVVALAQRNSEHKAQLLDLAEKLNYRRIFPHNFLDRAIESLRSAK